MNLQLKKDFAVSIFFALLALAYLLGAQSISAFSPFGNQGLDSKSIPRIIGGLTLLLSLGLFIQTLLRYRRQRISAEKAETAAEAQSRPAAALPLLLSALLLALYIAAYQWLGFILSSSLYLILQSLLLTPAHKRGKWIWFILLLSAVFPWAVYVVFSKYLSLFLPAGLLG